jgi:hypothetical protein
VHEILLSMCWVDIDIFVPFGLLYLLLYFFGNQLIAVIILQLLWN